MSWFSKWLSESGIHEDFNELPPKYATIFRYACSRAKNLGEIPIYAKVGIKVEAEISLDFYYGFGQYWGWKIQKDYSNPDGIKFYVKGNTGISKTKPLDMGRNYLD